MAKQTYDKKCVALAQIETALRLYFEGQDYFSVITLAGAAEEIFGKLLSNRGIENSFESRKRAVSAIHQRLFGSSLAERIVVERLNRARNALKHQGAVPLITIDAKEEAADMLQRCIENYWLLEELLTPSMERFERERMRT